MLISLTASSSTLSNIFGKSSSFSIGSLNNCWLGLFTTAPQSDGTGYVEVGSGKNYARVEIHSFISATNRKATNSSDINFNPAINPADPETASGYDWGSIVAVGLFNSATGGAPYAWGTLDTAISVLTKQSFHILAGDLEVNLTESAT